METALLKEDVPAALSRGVSALEELLVRHGFGLSQAGDEIAEESLEKEGPTP
jgi:hypothetical protein